MGIILRNCVMNHNNMFCMGNCYCNLAIKINFLSTDVSKNCNVLSAMKCNHLYYMYLFHICALPVCHDCLMSVVE